MTTYALRSFGSVLIFNSAIDTTGTPRIVIPISFHARTPSTFVSLWPKGQRQLMVFVCQGDGGYPLNLAVVDASNISVILQPTTGSDIVGTGTVTILDTTHGYVQYLPASSDISTAGTYTLRLQVTYATGTITSDGVPFTIVSV